MSRFDQLVETARIMTDIQTMQIKINTIYNKLTGKIISKKQRPIKKIERQFYRRQILVNMIKYSAFIEEFEKECSQEENLPYLDFIVDYYLFLSEQIDELNKYELQIEKILGLLND